MAAKVIGFNVRAAAKKSGAHVTASDYQENEIFRNACGLASEILDVPVDELNTRRQASKFMRGRGLVYDLVVKGRTEKVEKPEPVLAAASKKAGQFDEMVAHQNLVPAFTLI